MAEENGVVYSPGMRVLIRDEEWKIEKSELNNLGGQTLYAIGLSPLVRGKECRFLPEIEGDIVVVDPAQTRLIPDASPYFLKTRLYIESQLRRKAPTDEALHIGWKAAMDPLRFQLLPATKALKSLKARILIADTVGLGKTLEAGILISELIARGKGRRILVITVKSMMTQFQQELWNRFSIPLVRLDSTRIQRIRTELPAHSNPFFYYDRSIISVDTLKRDIEYRTHLENARWDIIVIDEAHNVADRSAAGAGKSQRARLAQLLAERSDNLIMLSATPHDGRPRSFASLIKMLDPTAIADPDKYCRDDFNDLFVRRFKKDVAAELSSLSPERDLTLVPAQSSPEEEEACRRLASLNLHMDERKLRARSGSESSIPRDLLFKTCLVKSLFSSPAACIKTIDNRLARLDMAKSTPENAADASALLALRAEVCAVSPASFSRYQKLLDILREQSLSESENRVVIFTERIETMKFLAEHLKADLGLDDKQIKVMSGAMSDVEQQQIVDEFGREASPLRVLVASDVASEGINLHYCCHRLIHFDIPWSIMTLNQRNGRIDRYGQKRAPDIRCLLVQSANSQIQGDARYLSILVEKEHRVHDNIGDPAALMNAWDPEAEALLVGNAMEKGESAEKFAQDNIDADPALILFEQLLHQSGEQEKAEEYPRADDVTLFSDLDFLTATIELYNASSPKQPIRYEALPGAPCIAIAMNDELKKRLSRAMPAEAFPADGVLRLSPDKKYCIDEMNRSRQTNDSKSAWHAVQYLWPLHPILDWACDIVSCSGLAVDRGQAPIACTGALATDETVVLVAGQIPNRRSVAVVDQWTGILFKEGKFNAFLTAEQTIERCRLREKLPNPAPISAAEAERLRAEYLAQSVDFANQSASGAGFDYERRTAPRERELKKRLESLRARHEKAVEQLTLFESVRNKRIQRIDAMFDEHQKWVADSLSIDAQRPSVRVIAILTGEKR